MNMSTVNNVLNTKPTTELVIVISVLLFDQMISQTHKSTGKFDFNKLEKREFSNHNLTQTMQFPSVKMSTTPNTQ